MKNVLNLYVIQFGDGHFSLPFAALNDHFATMAVNEMPEAKGCTLWRSGTYDTTKGSVKGRSHMHKVM